MMTTDKFEFLLSKNEGPDLDFKRQQYELIADKENIQTSKFIKDIISFANTKRDGDAHIIIGVDDNNGSKELLGLDIFLDDAIFQDKIKDKVSPRPKFTYSSFEYQSKRFGIITIPVVKYSEPVHVTKSLKGLVIDKVYFRRGSTNSEATIKEIIEINDWFRSIKVSLNTKEILSQATILISRINEENELLSRLLPEALQLGKNIGDEDLTLFCQGELLGWSSQLFHKQKVKAEDYLNYRKAKVIVSPYQLTNVQSYGRANIEDFWRELIERKGFVESPIIFTEPISSIEHTLQEYKKTNFQGFSTLQRTFQDFIPHSDAGDMPIFIYSNFYITKSLYISCKQRFTQELFKIIE